MKVTRDQILAFRRRAGGLDERLPRSAASLRRAAWAGLQDSMPRAAVLSLHARVRDVPPAILDDRALAQLWGPRFSVYVVAARDFAIFSLGRYPEGAKARERAEREAARVREALRGGRATHDELGARLGVNPNMLKYGAATGTIAIRWEGARSPLVWNVERPAIDPAEARRELARRHLHVFGPTTAAHFAVWAGVKLPAATATYASLERELLPVRTPLGDELILAADEEAVRAGDPAPAPARLLPSGDAYYLLQGAERALLVPDASQRARLWTTRVWPGALLVDGELRGTWRRDRHVVRVEPWSRLDAGRRAAVEAEAATLPLPLERAVEVRWE
ncbi:MAG: crosslink repair DNA glycosylase YcaQ family protein [Actinomycetota bacterium]